MKTKEHSHEDLIDAVIAIADREGFAPSGLADYLGDLAENPDAYNGQTQKIIDRLLKGYDWIKPSDITRAIASKATHVCQERRRESVSKAQERADKKGKNITYVLEDDPEYSMDKVQKRRREKLDKETIFGHTPESVLRWAGSEGWTYRQAKEFLKARGFDIPKEKALALLQDGDENGYNGSLTDEQQAELWFAMEELENK